MADSIRQDKWENGCQNDILEGNNKIPGILHKQITIITIKPSPKTTPSSTPKSTPISTPKSTPMTTPKTSPTTTPKTSPKIRRKSSPRQNDKGKRRSITPPMNDAPNAILRDIIIKKVSGLIKQ